MPYIRMKRIFLQGLLWLYLFLEFGYMALSIEPGFLDFDNLPDTNFSCVGKVIGGYYADLETNCQMFHVCTIGQLDEPMDIKFLCLNGTVFDQETRVCERIDEVDCAKSERFYSLNLELYGNTQSAVLEDSPETEQPLIIKSTTSTPTTTTKPKVTNIPFHTSVKPSTLTTQAIGPNVYSLGNSPDIRFNPEEINISLHPGAPPDIRTKPASYQQQTYSDNNKKVVVTTHSEYSDNKKVPVTTYSTVFDDGKVLSSGDHVQGPQVQVPTTQKSQKYGHSNSQTNKNFHPTPSDINYEFTFRQTESSHQDFLTDFPDSFFNSDFHSDQDYAGHHHNPLNQQFKSSTFHNDYTPTTKNINHQPKFPTTTHNYFLQSLKPPAPNQPHHYNDQRTEKAHRVQLPIPVLPTLPPLTFSSPAPFSLQHHIDTKRSSHPHPSPPRIVISASASVSDASGRRLNYSLGTIGAAEILEQAPQSYDEYKDEDVGLDPFYHDVPKLKRSRRKRDAGPKIKHTDIIRNEQEAVDVLKFLFDWYKNNERTATESTTVPTIVITDSSISKMKTDVEDTTVPITTTEMEIIAEASEDGVRKRNQGNFKDSELINRNVKYTTIGNNTTAKGQKIDTEIFKGSTTEKISKYDKDFLDELFGYEDYVNDNFESIAYKEKYGDQENKVKKEEVIKSVNKEKNPFLPKDYVDDNIEPIYYKDRNENIKNITTGTEKVTNNIDVTYDKVTQMAKKSLIDNTQSTILNNKVADKIRKPLFSTGDTETNDIKQNVLKEEKQINSVTSKSETSTVSNVETTTFETSEPKSEILESVTTEIITSTSIKPRSNSRRGRKRYNTTTDKEKEPVNKNVVLEKITERAHTAKDDFNYLRTLYKVYTTTPTYNTEKEKNSKETIDIKMQKSSDYDFKEASPSDKVIRTSLEKHNLLSKDNESFQPQDFIPFVTTEGYTSTTEQVTPTRSSEMETISFSVTTTTESISLPTTNEIVKSTSSSNTMTEENVLSSTTVSEGTTISSNITTDSTLSSNTATTTENVPHRRDSRRRGRNRHIEPTRSRNNNRIHSRRKPALSHEIHHTETTSTENIKPTNTYGISNSKRETIQSNTVKPIINTHINLEQDKSTKTTNATHKDKEIVIEENGSNINRNIVPYPITTEYTSTLPNNIQTEHAEFLTQLTLNYKKIFEDISQISVTIPTPILDASTLPVTEAHRNIASSSLRTLENYGNLENKKELKHIPERKKNIDRNSDLLPTLSSTINTTLQGNAETTTVGRSEEIVTTLSSKIITEDQILQNENKHEEITTSEKSPTIDSMNVKSEKSLQTVPTTLPVTEESTKNEEVTETTQQLLHSPTIETITEKLLDKIEAHETTTFSPTTVASTSKSNIQERTENIESSSTSITRRHDVGLELTTINPLHEETHQTSPIPIINETSPILRITEIFKLHSITPEMPVFEPVPTTLLTTETYMPDDIINQTELSTQNSKEGGEENSSVLVETFTSTEAYKTLNESNKIDSNNTEHSTESTKADDLTTIYIVRTTENLESNKENEIATKDHIKEMNIKETETETYPSTVVLIRTTESPKIEEHTADILQRISSIRQLQRLIEEIEGSTKSIVATSNTPTTISEIPSTSTEKLNEQHAESTTDILGLTERRKDLEELNSLYQYTTGNNYVATTPTMSVPQNEELTESIQKLVTTEIPNPNSDEIPTTMSSVIASDPELMSTRQIVRLTATEKSTTVSSTTSAILSNRSNSRRGTRPGRTRHSEVRRHRFSTESVTRRPEGRRQTVEEEIINELSKNSKGSTTESYRRRLRVRPKNNEISESSTDAPLQKSASPTRAERTRESLPTTPLSKEGNGKRFFIFNCFGKEVDKFYPDPRDCRLFHYCTQGYNKNQLIDMKFVCDLNTYFDDVKLICSRKKPRRCL